MAKAKSYGSVKRFGSRYGRTTRIKVANIESVQKRKHICPFCNKNSVKRVSSGIWQCSKCGAKFSGKAYTFDRKRTLSDVSAEEVQNGI